MKKKCRDFLILFSFYLSLLVFVGFTSVSIASPVVLEFQIDVPWSTQYHGKEFSYIIDKENPFWIQKEGDNIGDINKYKYNVAFYTADSILMSLPDLILNTTSTIGDIESGWSEFVGGDVNNANYIDIFSNTTWYLWDLLYQQHRFDFFSQQLGIVSLGPNGETPGVWLNSVTAIPEPSTLILLGFGVTSILRLGRKRA